MTQPVARNQPIPFRVKLVQPVEQVAFLTALLALSAPLADALMVPTRLWMGVTILAGLSVFYTVLARRWETEWLLYVAEATLAGSYLYYRAVAQVSPFLDLAFLALFCGVLFGLSEFFEGRRWLFYARPALNFSLLLALCAPVYALARGELDEVNLSLVSFGGLFFSAVCYRRNWKNAGYLAGLLYNAVLWMWWMRTGWGIADHPQFYLVPVGFSVILFAEVNRGQLGVQSVNSIRTMGSLVIALSTAVPIWQFQSFGSWLFLLVASLGGILAGIALRVQTFVWMGLLFFVLDVTYQLTWVGIQYALAKWAIMVGLGILLLVFVALNEKKQIAVRLRDLYFEVRQWE